MTKATDFRLGEIEHVIDVCSPIRVENTAGEAVYEYSGYFEGDNPFACEFPEDIKELYVIFMNVQDGTLVITVTE